MFVDANCIYFVQACMIYQGWQVVFKQPMFLITECRGKMQLPLTSLAPASLVYMCETIWHGRHSSLHMLA